MGYNNICINTNIDRGLRLKAVMREYGNVYVYYYDFGLNIVLKLEILKGDNDKYIVRYYNTIKLEDLCKGYYIKDVQSFLYMLINKFKYNNAKNSILFNKIEKALHHETDLFNLIGLEL